MRVSDVARNLQWLTPLDWALVAALLLFAAGLLTISAVGGARQRAQARARREQWARRYFREGGVVIALMKRWRNPVKLTDQRDRARR